MAASDLVWDAVIDQGLVELNVALVEIALEDTTHLIENLTNLEVSHVLAERSLANVVDLLEVEDSVKNALCFVQSLLCNRSALCIKVVVEFLQVDEGNL